MKLFKILPTAASVIAMTATVAFAQDVREREEDAFSRTVVTVSQLQSHEADSLASAPPAPEQASEYYQVNIRRGERLHQVLIDAYTGQVLGQKATT